MDGYVLESRRGGAGIDDFEKHGAAVLVEEFGGRVDVVVCASVRAANDHYGVALRGGGGRVIDAVVVDGGLEEVGVFGEPAGAVNFSGLVIDEGFFLGVVFAFFLLFLSFLLGGTCACICM